MSRRWQLVLLSVLCLAELGGSPVFREFKEPVFGEWVGTVRLGVAMSRHLHPGCPIVARLFIENTSKDPVVPAVPVDFTLTDENGVAVPLTLGEMHRRDHTERKFPSTGSSGITGLNGVYMRDILFHERFDTSLAGRYSARVTQQVFDVKLHTSVTLRSPEITFDLAEEE